MTPNKSLRLTALERCSRFPPSAGRMKETYILETQQTSTELSGSTWDVWKTQLQ